MATYPCPHCGHPCLTPKDAANHCADTLRITRGATPGAYECPLCRGTGEKAGGIFSPNMPCPRCDGSGRIG